MMKTYEESAVASGLNVITDRPYMHYAWHPKWQEAKAAALLSGSSQELGDAFITAMVSLLAVAAAAYGTQAVLRARAEEEAGRAEPLKPSTWLHSVTPGHFCNPATRLSLVKPNTTPTWFPG